MDQYKITWMSEVENRARAFFEEIVVQPVAEERYVATQAVAFGLEDGQLAGQPLFGFLELCTSLEAMATVERVVRKVGDETQAETHDQNVPDTTRRHNPPVQRKTRD